jgi:hypothetical protein
LSTCATNTHRENLFTDPFNFLRMFNVAHAMRVTLST